MVITIPVTSAHADPGHGSKPSFGHGPSPSKPPGRPDGNPRGNPSHGNPGHHAPYPGRVPTSTWITSSSATVGKPATVSVDVGAFGAAKATGTVTVTVTGPRFSDTKSITVHGGWASVKTKPLTSAGLYFVKATYTPSANSVFAPSSGVSGFFAVDLPWWWGWPWF